MQDICCCYASASDSIRLAVEHSAADSFLVCLAGFDIFSAALLVKLAVKVQIVNFVNKK